MALLRSLFDRRGLPRRKELEDMSAGLLALYECAPVAVAFTDVEGRFIRVNPAFEQLLGYAKEELRGLHFNNVTHTDDVPACQALYDSVNAGTLTHFELEKRFVKKDHSLVWAYVVVTRVCADGGDPVLVGVAIDVTQRRAIEERLKESETQYRSLYNRTPAMMHSIDADRRLVSVSDLWLEKLGYKRHEVLGRRSVEFLTPRSRRYADEVVLPEFFRLGWCKDVPYQFVKKNGELLEVLLSATAEYDQHGRIKRSLAVLDDVTERRRAEEKVRLLNLELEERVRRRTAELERSNKDLQAYAYAASHDLSAPLRKITAFGELLEKLAAPKLDLRELDLVRRMRQAASSLTSLINDILSLSTIGRDDASPEAVPLDAVVAEVLVDLEVQLAEAGAEIAASGLPVVRGHRSLLHVLFENLVGNALKFRRPDVPARITISSRKAPEGVEVSVADNGIGFDPKLASAIFQPFRRLNPPGRYHGSGIGLAICERIAARHGGRIAASSSPGEGAVFTLWLPASAVI